ncbi:hypothetical protein ACH495_29270 [Micromonospora sp. NPDC018662]|uniref:hypothetical protein n=1 Tax=Micromonospora sp. NPDC018662 TaxID=3364238 RepID=UPI00379C5E82
MHRKGRSIRNAAVLATAIGAGLSLVAPSMATAAPVGSAEVSADAVNEPPNWTPAGFGTMTSCNWRPSANGSGGATVAKSIWLRTGPGAGCGNASGYSIPVGSRLGGRCFAYNDAGNKWYYVSVGGTDPLGWIYSGNVKNVSTFDTPC